MRQLVTLCLAALMLLPGLVLAEGEQPFILVQSTTSTQNSGLFDYLLPIYREQTGVDVRVIAVGTGQALKNAADGNGDVVMVHAKSAEEAFVAEGHGVRRYPVMYNDFVILGPISDPANIKSAATPAEALRRIAAAQATFVSRGDDSGTHIRELELWRAADLAVDPAKHAWYKDTGSGMGRTIAVAVELGAYTLSDRATWLAYAKRGEHAILLAGDPTLFNQYSLIMVNPERHPGVKVAASAAFIEWMLGAEGQATIAAFKLNGEQLFYPNAGSDL